MNYFYSDNGALISNTVIVGNSNSTDSAYTPTGIIIAWDRGQLWSNVSFYNFPGNTTAIKAPIILNRCE
jgi:hypothetical protein